MRIRLEPTAVIVNNWKFTVLSIGTAKSYFNCTYFPYNTLDIIQKEIVDCLNEEKEIKDLKTLLSSVFTIESIPDFDENLAGSGVFPVIKRYSELGTIDEYINYFFEGPYFNQIILYSNNNYYKLS